MRSASGASSGLGTSREPSTRSILALAVRELRQRERQRIAGLVERRDRRNEHHRELVLELQTKHLGGFLADARDAREREDVFVRDRAADRLPRRAARGPREAVFGPTLVTECNRSNASRSSALGNP
jgi:hypothetical protein